MTAYPDDRRAPWFATLSAFAVVTATATLSACMTPHYMDLETSSYAMTADKRTIISVPANRDASISANKPTRIICPEPSPDIAKAVSRAIEVMVAAERSAPGGVKQDSKGSFSSTSVESLVQLGQRTVTIQAIRDEYADLCRSYANGAVNSSTYTIRLARLDRKMMSMHTSEMIAGNFGGTLASISAGAAGPASPAKVIAAGEALEKKLGAWKQACVDKDTIPDECKPKADLVTALATAQDDELQALMAYVRGVGVGLSSTAVSAKVRDPDVGKTSADALVAVQAAFLTKDDLAILVDACVTALDYVKPRHAGAEDPTQRAARIDALRTETRAVDVQRQTALKSMEQAAVRLADVQRNAHAARSKLLQLDAQLAAVRATVESLTTGPLDKDHRKKGARPAKGDVAAAIAAEARIAADRDREKANVDVGNAEVAKAQASLDAADRAVSALGDTLARLDAELAALDSELSPFGRWCAGHLSPLLDDARKTAETALRTRGKVVDFCLDRWRTRQPDDSPEVTALCGRVARTADALH